MSLTLGLGLGLGQPPAAIPANAIVDDNGVFIVDDAGNFILAE